MNPTLTFWISKAKNPAEIDLLTSEVEGILPNYLRWVEEQITKGSAKPATNSDSPIQLRINMLREGIVQLQECKFICDTLENALRVVLWTWLLADRRYISFFLKTLPRPPGKVTRISVADFENSEKIQTLILNLAFYELTEVMSRNWQSGIQIEITDDKTMAKRKVDSGIARFFWQKPECRDVNLFRKEMGTLRRLRNDLAHCKRLFILTESRQAFAIASRWLATLKIDLLRKIENYRTNRPKFMQEIQTR